MARLLGVVLLLATLPWSVASVVPLRCCNQRYMDYFEKAAGMFAAEEERADVASTERCHPKISLDLESFNIDLLATTGGQCSTDDHVEMNKDSGPPLDSESSRCGTLLFGLEGPTFNGVAGPTLQQAADAMGVLRSKQITELGGRCTNGDLMLDNPFLFLLYDPVLESVVFRAHQLHTDKTGLPEEEVKNFFEGCSASPTFACFEFQHFMCSEAATDSKTDKDVQVYWLSGEASPQSLGLFVKEEEVVSAAGKRLSGLTTHMKLLDKTSAASQAWCQSSFSLVSLARYWPKTTHFLRPFVTAGKVPALWQKTHSLSTHADLEELDEYIKQGAPHRAQANEALQAK